MCDRPKGKGTHDLPRARAETLPVSACPRCGGGPDDGYARCEVGGVLFYACSCGVRWQEPPPR